jgi:hypothetical protein
MICQCCGVEAPTKQVEFYQNIGALVIRFHQSVKGRLCKSCIHKYFWRFTLVNLFLGWWGTISLLLNPFLILNNIVRYVGALKLQPVPKGATAPILTEDVFQKLELYRDELVTRLNGGEMLETVLESVAARVGVTPGQVMLYVHMLYESAQQA